MKRNTQEDPGFGMTEEIYAVLLSASARATHQAMLDLDMVDKVAHQGMADGPHGGRRRQEIIAALRAYQPTTAHDIAQKIGHRSPACVQQALQRMVARGIAERVETIQSSFGAPRATYAYVGGGK